jgi:hypothetical protein
MEQVMVVVAIDAEVSASLSGGSDALPASTRPLDLVGTVEDQRTK